jgi:hypothetical protein
MLGAVLIPILSPPPPTTPPGPEGIVQGNMLGAGHALEVADVDAVLAPADVMDRLGLRTGVIGSPRVTVEQLPVAAHGVQGDRGMSRSISAIRRTARRIRYALLTLSGPSTWDLPATHLRTAIGVMDEMGV